VAQLLSLELVPMPPLCAPRLALPPPVSLMPRFRPAPLLRLRLPPVEREVVPERVPEAEREPAPERLLDEPVVVSPAVSSMLEESLSLLRLRLLRRTGARAPARSHPIRRCGCFDRDCCFSACNSSSQIVSLSIQ
jgi:hypothetical protein